MQIGRRPVLQGLAASGLAVATGNLDVAEGHSPRALSSCLVLTEEEQRDAFLTGVRSVFIGEVVHATPSFDLHVLTKIFDARKRSFVLGLVDDGLAAIMIEMGRDAGAELLWIGHHTMRDGHTRHRLLTASQEGGARFAQALDSCAPSLVTACSLHGTIMEYSHSGGIGARATAEHWAVVLGAVLASASVRAPCPQIPVLRPAGGGRAGPDVGSLVSFGFEL